MQNVTYLQKNRDKLLQKRKEYHEKNKDVLLQKPKGYYEKNKEERKEYRRNKYNNMSKEETLNALKYRREWYHKLDIEGKRRIRNYSKISNHLVEVNREKFVMIFLSYMILTFVF